jgi:hypothetical protein
MSQLQIQIQHQHQQHLRARPKSEYASLSNRDDQCDEELTSSSTFSFTMLSQLSPPAISLDDAIAQSLAIILEPTPFRDGMYLQATDDSGIICPHDGSSESEEFASPIEFGGCVDATAIGHSTIRRRIFRRLVFHYF